MTPRRLIVVFLGTIAMVWGAAAVIQPWTRPFSSALAVAAAAIFLLVLTLRVDFRLPALKVSKRRQQMGALAFGVCTTLGVILVVFAPWQPAADFDVTGILWLMQNLVPFMAAFILAAGAIVGLLLWFRG